MQQMFICGHRAAAKFIEEEFQIPTSPETMRSRAKDGTGPEYRRFGEKGRVLYTPEKIREWVISRLRQPKQ